MQIKVLGSGCRKCNDLYDNAAVAAARFGEAAPSVVKISDVDEFFRLGVRVTPGLAVDDEVVSMGKVLSADEIAELIAARQS